MMRRFISLLLMLATLAVVAPVFAQDVDDPARAPGRARRALAATQKYRDAGEHERAAGILAEALADHPDQDHHLLRLHLALSLRALGRDAEALVHLNAAAGLEPGSRNVQLARAGAALAVEAYGDAAASLEAAWRLAPDEGPALLHDAVVARLLADESERAAGLAAEFLDVAATPTVQQLRTVLTASMHAESPALALRVADRAVTVHADAPEAWILVSQVRQSVDDLAGAAAALQAADWLSPLTADERTRLGDLLFAAGVPARAAAQYVDVFGDDPDADQAERLASAWFAAHRLDEAVAVLRRAVASVPSVRLWALLGDALLESERYDEAAEAYRSCLTLGGEDDDLRARLDYCETLLN